MKKVKSVGKKVVSAVLLAALVVSAMPVNSSAAEPVNTAVSPMSEVKTVIDKNLTEANNQSDELSSDDPVSDEAVTGSNDHKADGSAGESTGAKQDASTGESTGTDQDGSGAGSTGTDSEKSTTGSTDNDQSGSGIDSSASAGSSDKSDNAEASDKSGEEKSADDQKASDRPESDTSSDDSLLTSYPYEDSEDYGPEDEDYYTPAEPEQYKDVIACGDYEYVLRDDSAVITGYTGSDIIIEIPEELDGYTVTKIGDRAFCGKTFASLTVPETVKAIGVETFEGCRFCWAEDIEYDRYGFILPDSLIEIGERAFKDLDFNVRPFIIPAGIQTIGRGAFEDSFTVVGFADGLEKVPDYACYKGSRIYAVELPESVTEIGKYAFYKCTSLNEISWYDGITKIGKSALWGCTSIREAHSKDSSYYSGGIVMPEKLKDIGDYAFGGWGPEDESDEWGYHERDGEVSVRMPRDLERFSPIIFSGTKIGTLFLPANIEKIGEDEFGGRPDYSNSEYGPLGDLFVNDIHFESNSIPDFFCKGMQMLRSISIPDEIGSIGREAFMGCRNLHEVQGCEDDTQQGYFDRHDRKRFEYLSFVGERAFEECFLDWEYVYFPEFFDYIGEEAFAGCRIENVYFPAMTKSSEEYGFWDQYYRMGSKAFSSAKKITFAEGTTYIPDHACDGDNSLEEVVIPDTVEEIGNYAFQEAGFSYYEKELTFPENITRIGEGAFKNCGFVIDNIPSKVTDIPAYAYSECTFKSGTGIPSGVYSIGKYAFSKCKMDSVVIPSSVTELAEGVLSGAKFNSLSLHGNIYSIGEKAFSESNLTSISIPGSVSEIPESMCNRCGELSRVTFSNGNTEIGKNAFYECKKLVNVTLPDSVTEVGDYAFRDSGIESVKFGKNVSTIGKEAFAGTALTGVEIPKSVYSLESGAFLSCTKLVKAKLPVGITEIPVSLFQNCTSLTEIEIPDGCTTIGNSAFYNCKALKTIRIPMSLATVERAAFKYSGLRTVKYPGTIDDYKLIKIYSDNSPFTSATKEYMSFGDQNTPGVILSSTSVNLEVGDTKKLYAVVYPRQADNQHVTWSSSDTEVATVDYQGKITAQKVGRATVQAKADNGLIASCFVSVTNGGLSIKNLSFDDGTPKIKVPENIPIYGGKDFSVGMPIDLPITVIWEDGYVKIGINVSLDALSGDNHKGLEKGENWKSFKQEWEEFLDDVRKTNQLTTKDLEWFKSAQARQNLRANIPGVKGKVSVGAAGYMEAFWTEGQDKIQGELLLMIEGSETFTGQFTLVGVPVTVIFKVGADGTLMADFGYDFSKAKWYGDVQLMASLNLDLFFGAGAGDWLSAGVYGKASASTTIALLSPEKHSTPLKDWSLSGEAGLRANFAKQAVSLPVIDGTYDIYKDFKKVDHSKKKTNSLYSSGQTVEIDSSGKEFYVSPLDTTEGVLYSQAADDGTIVYDVYNAAKPTFVSSDDATMLVYVTDDKGRGLLDQTKLVYSIYDGATGAYGEAKAVLDDGSADYEPVVYSNGNDIYVAWLDSARIYGANKDSQLPDYTGAFKLHVARYNPESGEFDDLGTMQDKGVSSYTYLTRLIETQAGLEVVYVENKDNALFGLSDNNSINRWRLENGGWTKIDSIDSLKAVSSLVVQDLGGGQLGYAYVIDKDNDFSTNAQSVVATAPGEHYEYDVEGISNIAFTELPTGRSALAANIDGGIYYLDVDGFKELLPKGTMNRDSKFEVSGDSIYFLVNGDENRNIAVATYSYGEWGTTLLTHENDYVDYFSVMGDKICYLCNHATIGEGPDFDISSRIKVLSGTAITDVELEDVDYSPSSANEGGEFLTYLYIKNNGTKRLDNVRASVTYNGNEIAADNINVDLMPGEVQSFDFSFDLPEKMSAGGDFEIKVTTAEETDYSNNSKTISLKKADLGVHAIYDDSGEVPKVEISVENKGLLDSGMTITVKDEEGNILYEETGMAQAGQLLVYKEDYTAGKKQVLTIEVTGDADEFYLMDNTTSVSVGKDSQETDPSVDPSGEPEKEQEEEPEKEDAFVVKFPENAASPYSGLSYNYETKRYETVFTGNKVMPEVIVNGYAGRLTEGVDYTVTYSNNVNANAKKPAIITITGKGNYTGKKKLEFYIVKADLGQLYLRDMLTIQDEVRIQSGKKASMVVSYGDYTLKAADYTLSNTKAINQDTEIDVIGKGNFTGTLTGIKVHVLSAAEVKKLTIKAAIKADKRTYDGTEQKLSVAGPGESGELTVTAGTSKDILKEGKDFEVSYENNDKAGNAKVIIKGKGEYLGTVTKIFKIAPDKTSRMKCSLKDDSEAIYYDPAGAKPKIQVVAYRDPFYEILSEGKDYTVSYSANKKVGTGKYTVNFIGNYKGHAPIKNNTFEIAPAPLNDVCIYCGDMIYNKPGKYLSAPMIMCGTRQLGKKDVNIQYYLGEAAPANEITAKNKLNITLAEGERSKEITVVVTGKGNYEETSYTTSYKVYKADKAQIDLSKARIVAKAKNSKGKDIAVPAQEYTGAKVTPQIRVLIKNGKNWEEVDSSTYSVTYVNNVNKGSATIIVNGNGKESVGSISTRFKIGTRNMGIFSLLPW